MLSNIKKILSLLPTGDKAKLAILFLMILIATLFEVIGIGMIPVFVSIIASPELILEKEWLLPVWSFLGIEEADDLLFYGSILLIVIFVIKNSYLIFYKYVQAKFVWGRFSMIGSNLFKHYMSASYEFHLNRNTSELLRNVTQEVQYLAKFVMTPYLKLATDIVVIIGIFILLLWVEPLITLGVFVLLGGAGGFFLKLIKDKTRWYGKRAQNDRGYMIKTVNEGIGGLKDVRVLNRESWFKQRFQSYIKSYGKSQTFKEVASESTKPIIETIAITGMLLIGLILFWQGRGVESVISILALFGTATIRLMPAIRSSAISFTNLRYYNYTVDPIHNDSKEIESSDLKINAANEKPVRFFNSIEFENVSYRYPDTETYAVNNFSLSIPKGAVIGFVGSSGAGKTTVVDILLGLLQPQKGKILIDGVDVNENLSAWQKNIGYIPQFIFLADDTIRNNIAFGLPQEEIDENRLQSSLEAAQLTDLVKNLPKGLDTMVGERGTRLSGGQRQRIGIARAIYHDPQVLIMDEATSALDNITEKIIIDAIERLRGDRTIIMIAHRLTTVENSDCLYVLENGIIVEEGTYKQLIKSSKNFREMAMT